MFDPGRDPAGAEDAEEILAAVGEVEEDERVVVEVGQAHLGAAGEAVIGADDEVRADRADAFGGDAVVLGEVVVEGDLGATAAQGGEALLVVAFDDLDGELGMLGLERAEELREEERGDRLEAREDDRAADLLLPGLDRLDGVGDEPEDLPRLLEQALPRRGEDEPLRVLPDEERGAERLLELVDRRRHRRLGDVELLARRRHVERLRAFDEVRQLRERDRESVDHTGLLAVVICFPDELSR
ncbi:Uncharacterised protein [Mycobacteroides abscessus subsp. abscessus]|nr:Uncharacterised protein [Mycobacteroides abscessus subsp. abscessus]